MHTENIFLETSRLFIKAPSFSDLDFLSELCTNTKVMKYIEVARSRNKIIEHLENAIQHFEKHGFSFGIVIEKTSNKKIGQAGILYLGYDDTQSDIEIGYRLHPDFWKKGYATELARALIYWGFTHLSNDKLIAVIHPENQASRNVLEKVGMHYVGKYNAYNTTVAKYEIGRPSITLSDIKLLPATLTHYPIIQNLARFYVYDMSEYMGWSVPDEGLYECIDFKHYWESEHTFPFLIQYHDEHVGFVIINKIGAFPSTDYNMAQFFILRKFKRKGIGEYVAYQCFNKFNGKWEVMVIPGNEGAYRFWRSIIMKYTNHQFSESTQRVAHFDNDIKNIFTFESGRCISEHYL